MRRPGITLAALLFASALFPAACFRPGSRLLTGQVVDAGSGEAVYGAQVRFDGRSTRLFVTKEFRLTLADGAAGVLRVSAPGYADESREVRPRGRETRVDIALRGREVPGLAAVLVWAEREGGGLRLDIRLTDRSGAGIEHFPHLPFSAEVIIAENLGSADRPARGAVLFRGEPPLLYDPASRLEKLKCRIGAQEWKRPGVGVETGVLDFVLHTAQGDFRWTRADLDLREER